jgi:cellulose biosynthesis protein BcsQ
VNIIGVYNIKGGVGKTASAVNLGYLCACQGYRTLVWDLDPQGAASYYFRIKPKVKGSKKILAGARELDDVIKGTDFDNLDLLPADFSYRNMDLKIGESKKPTKLLAKLLRPLAAQYDYLFLDCPPSISLVSENIFRAADALIVPTIPTTLSLRTLDQLLDFIEGHKLDKTPVWPFFTMVDRRKKLHREILSGPLDKRAVPLRQYIPYASVIEKMGSYRMPAAEYAPRSAASLAYDVLWKEIHRRLPRP